MKTITPYITGISKTSKRKFYQFSLCICTQMCLCACTCNVFMCVKVSTHGLPMHVEVRRQPGWWASNSTLFETRSFVHCCAPAIWLPIVSGTSTSVFTLLYKYWDFRCSLPRSVYIGARNPNSGPHVAFWTLTCWARNSSQINATF